MNYIISGGLGFIGKNLSIKLAGLKSEFLVLDKLAGSDLCRGIIKVPECKTFVHLAALTNVRQSILNPKKVITENSLSTLNCLEYARDHTLHFIFTSSMGASQAFSPYSASKLACEAYCNAYRESYSLNITVLRLSNVYGPHSLHKGSVIPQFIKNCLNKEPLTIFGDGSQTRDFVHVDDVVSTILDYSSIEPINIGSGKPTSILDLAKMVQGLSAELTSFEPSIKFGRFVRGEILKVDPLTNIKPKISLEDGLRLTFNWYMEHYDYVK